MSNEIAGQFAARGYVVIEDLFTAAEVHALKEEAARVLAEVRRAQGEDAVRHGVYVGMAAASPVFRTAAAKPELAAALKAIIGERVTFLSDKVVFKDGTVDFGSPWHQDYPYWEGSHKYSVWIALDDATTANGCLKVWPGSHLKGALHHGEGDHDGHGFSNRLKEEEIDASQIVAVSVRRGTAIIFHDLLFHASYPNQSGQERMALISTYKDAAQEDPAYPWASAAFAL